MSPTVASALLGFALGLAAAAAMVGSLWLLIRRSWQDCMQQLVFAEMLHELREAYACVLIYRDDNAVLDGPARVAVATRGSQFDYVSYRAHSLYAAVRAAHVATFPERHP